MSSLAVLCAAGQTQRLVTAFKGHGSLGFLGHLREVTDASTVLCYGDTLRPGYSLLPAGCWPRAMWQSMGQAPDPARTVASCHEEEAALTLWSQLSLVLLCSSENLPAQAFKPKSQVSLLTVSSVR